MPLLVEREDVPPSARPYPMNYYPSPKRIEVSHIEGKGIGYLYGYTALGVEFAPYYEKGSILPIIDVEGLYFDNNNWGGNLGAIFRFIPETIPLMPGFNAFYAYRQGRRGNYNFLGVGVELLSAIFDFRFNGYIPFGQRRFSKIKKQKYEGGFVSEFQITEYAYSGFDAEVGALFFQKNDFFLYAAAGPFYVSGELGSQGWGVQARLQPQYSDYVSVDLSMNNSKVFGTIFSAELILSVPLYNFTSMKNRSGPGKITNRQIYQPVRRFKAAPIGDPGQCCWKGNF